MSCHTGTNITPSSSYQAPPESSFSSGNDKCSNIIHSLSCSGYTTLLSTNRNYRLYLFSHICQHAGDWFVHIANLITIERLAPNSGKALSILVLTKTIPDTVVTPFGGMLADTFDRRKLMVILDAVGSLVVLAFILAIKYESLEWFYVASTVRCVLHALFEPVTRSIVPMLVGGDTEELKRATTLSSMAWSTLMIIGGLIGAWASSTIGLPACYVIDSASYLISSFLMSRVTGSYVATPKPYIPEEDNMDKSTNIVSDCLSLTCIKSCDKKAIRQRLRTFFYLNLIRPLVTIYHLIHELATYLYSSSFGLLVLFKMSGVLTWGTEDILTPAFAYVPNDEDATAWRIGKMYSFEGLGCLIGPLVVNGLIVGDLRREGGLARLQLVCIVSFAIVSLGWLGISESNRGEGNTFGLTYFFVMVRTFGSSVIWVDSTLLLQTLSSGEMLGRVLGLEYSLANLAEAIMATLAGHYEDSGMSMHDISRLSAAIGLLFFALWTTFHMFRKGAANMRFQHNRDSDENEKVAKHLEAFEDGISAHGFQRNE